MKKRFGASLHSAGFRLLVGSALAFTVLVAGPQAALARKGKSATKAAPATKADSDTKSEAETQSEQTPPDTSADAAPAPAKEEPKPPEEEAPPVKHVVPPYSLPWQLRPVVPVTMLRSDTSFAFYGVDGATIVSLLSGSYKIIPRISIFGKLAVANDSPPPPIPAGGFIFANPLLGAQVGLWPAKGLKLGLSLGLTVPVGSGGSASTDAGQKEATLAAMRARSGFDNALFMPDYFSILPGVDFAWVTHNLTLQAEMNFSFMTKVRGIETEKSSNTDMSLGLHVGYFFLPFFSAGLDFRYQYWLSKPIFVQPPLDISGASRDSATIAVGPRFHVKVSDDVTFRPGLSFGFGLDAPISSSHYKIVQLDLPFFF